MILLASGKYKKLRSRIVIAITVILFFLSAHLQAQAFENYELKQVAFSGNKNFSSSTLEKVILSKESPGALSQFFYKILGIGGEAVFFNPSYITTDQQRLKAFYMDNGFFETVFSHNYTIDSSDGSARLNFNIDEGVPGIVRKFELKGLESVAPSFLEMINNRLTIEKGQQYSANAVKENRAIVTNFLGDRGYMNVYSDRPNIRVDTLNNEVEIEIEFYPGKRFTISDIRINRTGVNKDEVDDQLLLDIVDIQQGKYFSYLANQRGEGRLYRTDLFRSALVMPLRNDTINNAVPIEISAEVGKIYEISPEIIINNEFKTTNLGVGTEFTKRNFLGSARKLTLALSVVSRDPVLMLQELGNIKDAKLFGYADGRIVMEQPFLFGNPIFTRYEFYLLSQKLKDKYNQDALGAKVSFNFELPRYTYITSLSTYFNWESSRAVFPEDALRNILFRKKNITPEDSLILENKLSEFDLDETFKSDNALTGVNIGLNKTNDPTLIYPTSGFNISLVLEDGNAIPYLVRQFSGSESSTPAYYKVKLNTSAYFPVFAHPRSLIATKFEIGHIHNYHGNKSKVPIGQRFYSGGSNSIRGWGPMELSPQENDQSIEDLDFKNLTREELEALFQREIVPGGFFKLETSVEARLHLSGDLGSAIFIDAGNNWNSYRDFNWRSVAVAAGFGFRYHTPLGPVRIDFGFKVIDPYENNGLLDTKFTWDAFTFQFGIGEAF